MRVRPHFRFSTDIVVIACFGIVVLTLVLAPPFFLLWSSLKPATGTYISDWRLDNFTLQNFHSAFLDPYTLTMLFDSVFFSTGAMLIAFLFGGVIAYLVERTNAPLRNHTYGLMLVPLILPSMLKAIGWIFLLHPNNGVLNLMTEFLGIGKIFNAYSITAMLWVQGLSMTPLTFLMLGASLRAMDPSLEEAASVSGAGRFTTLRSVTLKLMIPSITGAGLLQFVRGMEAFEVPLIMGVTSGVQVFATNIYLSVREIQPPAYGQAFALSVVLMAIGITGLLLYKRTMSEAESYVTITGRGYRPRVIDLGRGRVIAGGFIVLYLFVAIGLPFLMLLWVSFLPFYQLPSWNAVSWLTLENYRQILTDPDFLRAAKNTIIVSSVVALGCMLISAIISWFAIRHSRHGGEFLDNITFIPYVVPGIAIGLSFLVLFLSFPNPIYGTIWILVLVYIVSFLPIAARFSHAGIKQIHRELEEAAKVCGSSFPSVMQRIVIPLILPSLLAGGLYVFVLSAKVASQAAMLWSPESIVLPMYILQAWMNGSVASVSALSVMMIASFVLLAIGLRISANKFLAQGEEGQGS